VLLGILLCHGATTRGGTGPAERKNLRLRN
jgi:hypothetical protein